MERLERSDDQPPSADAQSSARLHSDVTTLQWTKLQTLLRYAAVKVPYYRSLFQNLGLRPEDIRSFQDFAQLPCLTKQIVQEQWNDFISEDYQEQDLIIRYTSGSTGTPLRIAHTRPERIIAARHVMRARMRWGLQMPARWAVVGGANYFITGIEEEIQSRQYAGWRILRLPCRDLTPATLQCALQELEAFQPTWIYGLPGIVNQLGRLALQQGKPIGLAQIQLVELAGEYLLPEVRQQIQAAFQYPPANQYASREFRGIAFECPQGGMHVLGEHVYLEVVTENGRPAEPGEVGETVITSLNSRAMPLIRYRQGDLARSVTEMCRCQDAYPLIEIAGGRTSEFIVGQSGLLGSLVFNAVFRYLDQQGYRGVREYRVIQRAETDFEVWVVAASEWSAAAQELFIAKATSILGPRIQFRFKQVAEIPSPSGKSRLFVVDLQ